MKKAFSIIGAVNAQVSPEASLSFMFKIVPFVFVHSLFLSFHESDVKHFCCWLVTIFFYVFLLSAFFPVFRFIEYGRYNGYYYGTSLDSVHSMIAEGKVCLLDVHPSVSIMPSKIFF